MTSAFQAPQAAVVLAANGQETIQDAGIVDNALTDTTSEDHNWEIPTFQAENNVDDHLSKLMYCLPISESERKVDDLHVSSSGSSPLAAHDRSARNTREAFSPKETKVSSISSGSSPVIDRDLTTGGAVAAEETEEKEASLEHPERCACGCIPNTPSLFEMAELRRQHRLKLKNSNKSESPEETT